MKYSAWRYFDGHNHIFGQETNQNAESPFMWIRECLIEGMKIHGVESLELSNEDIKFLKRRWPDVIKRKIK